MDHELKREVARYLARLQEQSPYLWSVAAGVGGMVDGTEEATQPETEPVIQSSTDTEPTFTRKPKTEATSPIDAIRRGMEQAKQEWEMPRITEEGSNKVNGWERGAPEPEAVIPVPGQVEDPFPSYTSLDAFNEAISGCMKCPLGRTRNKFVYGVGDPNADLVLVGEAPGADEDRLGEPFVGRAGKLLDQILEAVQLKRGEGVYIANILKCRPPGNRDPLPAEVEQCEPHLVKQLQLLQPKLILALGRIAAQTLLRTSAPLGKLRGQVHDYHGIPLMVTFHPAALLRNPNWKRPTWEDVQEMKRLLDEKSA